MIITVLEVVIYFLDISNNLYGVPALIIGSIFGIIMCIFAKLKPIIICTLISFLLVIFGIYSCCVSGSIGYLALLMFFIPFTVVLFVFSIIKWLILKIKKFKEVDWLEYIVIAIIFGGLLLIAGLFDIKWLLAIFSQHNLFRELFGYKGFRYICISIGTFTIICAIYQAIKIIILR